MRFLLAFALAMPLIMPFGHADAQCAGGACAAPTYGYSALPSFAYQADAPVFRQYGGSGVVYSYHDPVALNAWLAVHDPARPAPAVAPTPPPPKDEAGACKCGEDCECRERPVPPFVRPEVPVPNKHRKRHRDLD